MPWRRLAISLAACLTITRERLVERDPALRALVLRFFAQRDTSASLPIALVNPGNQTLEDGKLADATALLDRALEHLIK